MEVVSGDKWSYRTRKIRSNCQHQQTNTHYSIDWMPNQQCQNTEEKNDTVSHSYNDVVPKTNFSPLRRCLTNLFFTVVMD